MLIQNQQYDYCCKILPTIFIGLRILSDEVACAIKQKFIIENLIVAAPNLAILVVRLQTQLSVEPSYLSVSLLTGTTVEKLNHFKDGKTASI